MKNKNFKFQIKPVNDKDREWVKDFIKKRWRSEEIVYGGKIFYPHKLKGFIAVSDKKSIGLITYQVDKKVCRVITIDSLIKRKGVGTSLINKVKNQAKELGCRKIIVITTNDNLDRLRFYQRRGFQLNKIYKNTVEKSRKIKPEIPKIGQYGIPIKDEIELELKLP